VAACERVGFDSVAGGDAGSADAPGIDAPVCAGVTTDDWLSSVMPLDANKQYAVGADGMTVLDEVTGLVWQRGSSASAVDFPTATGYCASLSLGGCMQWRLPQRIELTTLIDHAFASPAIDPNAFPGTLAATYWAVTPNTSANNSWVINFDNGNTFWNANNTTSNVRCVYGGAKGTAAPARYNAMPSHVDDLQTGLSWVRAADANLYTQAGAVANCASLALDGGGWRLPEVDELQTLIDTTRTNPSIDPTTFPGTPSALFWTNSAYNVAASMVVNFATGNTINAPPTDTYVARCVR